MKAPFKALKDTTHKNKVQQRTAQVQDNLVQITDKRISKVIKGLVGLSGCITSTSNKSPLSLLQSKTIIKIKKITVNSQGILFDTKCKS